MKKLIYNLILLLVAICLPVIAHSQEIVEIGGETLSTYNMPIVMNRNYSFVQQIYNAEEIGIAGTISSVGFYLIIRRHSLCRVLRIHPVRMNGTVLGVPQTLSYFEKMQDRIVSFITRNSRISEGELRRLTMNTGELVLDVGTVLEGEKAVELGLIDSLGSLGDAMDSLYGMIENTEKRYAD